MIKKFIYGNPIDTGAVIENIKESPISLQTVLNYEGDTCYKFTYQLKKGQQVYGLGEQVRGINKRGWIYESYNDDDAIITESRLSLYASHNFLVLDGEAPSGLFFDFAGKVTFDIGYTDTDVLDITCYTDGVLYIITEDTLINVVKTFRKIIGQSYIPPKWAFGIGQSRWGYKSKEDLLKVLQGYKKADLPLDMIYMDIDYMVDFEDFTLNKNTFPDFRNFVEEMNNEGIKLVPIIDAAIKVKDGYSVYDEGLKNNYYCKDKDGKPYVVGVWPGDSVLTDFLSKAPSCWFGSNYKYLLDMGIEGFWNDMNEPGLFYCKNRLVETLKELQNLDKEMSIEDFERMNYLIYNLKNNRDDHKDFYHDVSGRLISHDKVHNIYGYKMTQSAGEYFKKYNPNKRYLIFSRSSYIGMHRYGGIWTGDNCSWWSHILLILKMLPSLSMCGFLYTGADVGGFGQNTTEDLLLRWTALGIFIPLFRNHSTKGTRNQEPYEFKDIQSTRTLLNIRYMILPYLYSEFVKCAYSGDMLYKPLAFEYPDDKRAKTVEDQILMGESIMLAPVYEQNAEGRYVYLPEDMKIIRINQKGITEKILSKGNYYVKVGLDEVVFFLRKGKVMPIASKCKKVSEVDFENVSFLKYIDKETTYTMCLDDGLTTDDLTKYMKDIVVTL